MKGAQVSVYIILALVIAGLFVLFFSLSKNQVGETIPQEIVPIFEKYSDCIKEEAELAVRLAGGGGGRIFIKDYVPGSEYAPFASHLNFLGSPVEYWYSIEGNGVIKKNVPTLIEIEEEISKFVAEGLRQCNFELFYRQGFNIEIAEPEVNVEILERKVRVEVNADTSVYRGDLRAVKKNYNVEVASKLGKFYNLATGIYNEQIKKAFLENYSVDVLYNYAPVDGVEVQCGPKIWETKKVVDSIRKGLEQNIQTIKLSGNYYKVKDEKRNYFVHNYPVDESVNFLYFADWPSRIEIYGDGVDDEIIMAKPLGNEAGMEILGFCYAPYHFVYDVSFPVMIQIFDTNDFFQFPVVVIIDKNMPRKGLDGQVYVKENDLRLCDYMTEDIEVYLYDLNLNPINGNISFECFSKRCKLGESREGVFRGKAPACVNGFVHAKATGFAERKQTVSTNRENFVEIVLDRERIVNVTVQMDGKKLNDEVVLLSFVNDEGKSTTIALPEQKEIKLSEDLYDIKVYVYGKSSIKIPASTKTECVDAPRKGILGIFGMTKEECFDITLPETTLENSLVGGGVLETYLLDSQLAKGNMVVLVPPLPKPNSLEDLSMNFEMFDDQKVWIEFYEN